MILFTLILFTVLFKTSDFIISPKGPTHKRMATECLMQIVREHFLYLTNNDKLNYTLLLTIMVTSNLTTPSYEIQNLLIEKVNNLMRFPIETINNKRMDFKPFTECLNCPTSTKKQIIRRVPVENYSAYFVLMVVDSIQTFERKLDTLSKMSNFDPKNTFIVYFGSISNYFKRIALMILVKFWNVRVLHCAVLIPKDTKTFLLYRLELHRKTNVICGASYSAIEIDRCINSKMLKSKSKYFKYKLDRNYRNCTLNVITMPYAPFVINKREGIEIEVLNLLGKTFNIHFNITLMKEAKDWDDPDPAGGWLGPISNIYNDKSTLGIGNIGENIDFMHDFDFTVDYFSETAVWIVPIAEPVPKWLVLITIFKFYVWAVCIGSIFVFTFLFWSVSRKDSKEFSNYRQFGNAFLSSYRIFVTNATKAPKTHLARVFFYTFAILSIIISSLYTSSLMVYLKSPVSSYQIRTTDDVLDSDLGIGGLSSIKGWFDIQTDNNNSQTAQIYRRYQTVDEEFDTADYWLNIVAKYRNISTILGSLFVNYQLATQHPAITRPDGSHLVYVSEHHPLIHYKLSIVMAKGTPYKRNFNFQIRRLVEAGLVDRIATKYYRQILKDIARTAMATESAQGAKPLTLDHLQGVFVILIFGYLLAIILFIVEILVKKFNKTSVLK